MRVAVTTLALALAVLAGMSGAGAASTASTRVTITIWPQGRGPGEPVQTWTLRCAPARGTLPRPARACRALRANRGALRPVPASVACTERYGGPQVARVLGKIGRSAVRAWFNRSDGCEIERWNRLRVLFPVPVGAASSAPANAPEAVPPLASPPPSPPANAPPAPAPETELAIAVYPEGKGGAATHWTLTCQPVGGTLPQPEDACSGLAALGSPFEPARPGAICAMVFGGPQAATVTGRFRDAPVDASFDQTNGCEISRWLSLGFLFPPA